jgi:hypothetical protein
MLTVELVSSDPLLIAERKYNIPSGLFVNSPRTVGDPLIGVCVHLVAGPLLREVESWDRVSCAILYPI